MADKDRQLEALLELERRDMQNPGAMPEELKTKLKAYRDQGVAKPLGGGVDTTESERTAGFLTTRVAAGLKDLVDINKRSPEAMRPSLSVEVLRSVAPEPLANWATGSERQQVEASQIDILDAALTLGTGAAYTKEQIEGYRKAYFPQLGDDEKTIEFKRRKLGVLLEAAKVKAGGAASQIEEAMAAAGYGPATPDKSSAQTQPVRASNTGLVMADQAQRNLVAQLPPEKEAEIIKLAPYLTPETMVKWFKDNGYDIPPEQAQKAYEYYQQGGKEAAGIDYSAAEAREKEEAKKRLEDMGAGAHTAAVEGVGDTLSLGFGDEARAIGRSVFDGGTYRDNLTDVRAEQDVLSEESPISYIGGQLAGGALIPYGSGARTPGQLARVGGTLGTAYGVGSGEDTGSRIIGGLGGGLTGAGLGYGVGKIAQRFTKPPRGPSGPGPGREVMDAADRIGVDLLPADVGGPFTRGATAAARQGIISELPIARAVERSVSQGAAARDRAAAAAGSVGDSYIAGRAAQRGAESFVETSRTRAGRLYDAIPIGGDRAAELSNTRQTLTDINAKITSNPQLAKMLENPQMKGYATALADKGLSWNDLKAFRTEIGHKLDGLILSENTSKQDLDRLYGALSADMEATASAAGPDALAKFERANRYYRARQDRIKTVLLPILGKDGEKGGGAAFNQIQNWAKVKGESVRVGQLFRSLPDDEKDVVSATIISDLGKATAGVQSAAGDAFSFSTFLTQWNKLEPRAKTAMFRPEVRKTLDDLAKVSEGAKATSKYANTSNTGRAVAGQAVIAAVAGGVLDMGTLLAGSAGQYLTGAMLASPRFARWLANAPQRSNGVKSWVAKLPKIASQNPAIANDIAAFERQLLSAVNDNAPRSVAASEGQQEQR